MEEVEEKRKDWLLLRGIGEADTQESIRGQTPGSTSLSAHRGEWPKAMAREEMLMLNSASTITLFCKGSLDRLHYSSLSYLY